MLSNRTELEIMNKNYELHGISFVEWNIVIVGFENDFQKVVPRTIEIVSQ